MYICIHIHICIYIYTHTHIYIHIYTHIHVDIHIYAYKYAYMSNTHAHSLTPIYTRTRTHACVYTCMHFTSYLLGRRRISACFASPHSPAFECACHTHAYTYTHEYNLNSHTHMSFKHALSIHMSSGINSFMYIIAHTHLLCVCRAISENGMIFYGPQAKCLAMHPTGPVVVHSCQNISLYERCHRYTQHCAKNRALLRRNEEIRALLMSPKHPNPPYIH